jgi:hypothetical protein
MLKKEGETAATSPLPCYGASLTAIRQRVVLIGGWASKVQNQVGLRARERERDGERDGGIRRGILVLEMENEIEKQRRLQEELHARLERER